MSESSNVIMFRWVMNDINVGSWSKDWWKGLGQPKAHTIDGLREWMKVHGFDPSLLEKRTFNSHIWSYRDSQQFWVPTPEEAIKGKILTAVCTNSNGLSWMKEGDSFPVVRADVEMVTIMHEGEEREVFSDRFVLEEA